MSDINSYLERSSNMTVGQLREQLENFNDDDIVLLAYTASDYWRSHIAKSVQSVEETEVFYTDYHQCAQERDRNDEKGEGTDDECVKVVVIC